MPEFQLDTAGGVYANPHPNASGQVLMWRDLDSFTQGYLEALFFTESGDGALEGLGFVNLAQEALEATLRDCRAFYAAHEATIDAALEASDCGDVCEGEQQAGRDFWYTRNGHGCGFWDGDWPEPHAATLTAGSKAFGEVDAYLGDDGKVHLS